MTHGFQRDKNTRAKRDVSHDLPIPIHNERCDTSLFKKKAHNGQVPLNELDKTTRQKKQQQQQHG